MLVKRKRYIVSNLFLLVICTLAILYITLLSRAPSLVRDYTIDPFHTYRSWFAGSSFHRKEILQNIALFIPCGFFLTTFLSGKKPFIFLVFLIGLGISLLVEVMQYYTGRGTADAGDVINNTIGAGAGAVIFVFVHWLEQCSGKKICLTGVTVLLIIAMLIGCIQMHDKTGDPTPDVSQFDFCIETVSKMDGLVFTGHCETYHMQTPDYTIYVKDQRIFKAETEINGDAFTAKADVPIAGNYEILIKFQGFPRVSTATWIKNGEVAYVGEDVIKPENERLEGAVLKAASAVYDVLVYQREQELIWLIGYDIDDSTEIIYHIDTNEPEKLPENRKQYGFDNLGFRATSNETEGINHYRVFVREIPEEYNITGITVGFNVHEKITWSKRFRVSKRDLL